MLFRSIYDLERLIGRIAYRSANPRDLVSFKNSLQMLPHIRTLLREVKAPLLQELVEQMDSLEDLAELLESALWKIRPSPSGREA